MTEAKKPWLKRFLALAFILVVVGGLAVYYIFTEKFEDTSTQKSSFTVSAIDLINEFKANDSAANSKYAEKIVTVKGIVTATEAADTTVNVKMVDPLTDSYIIFAFQQQHMKEATQLKEGDMVSIKGSCSGGTYSKILETEFISFKRCAINK
ncbi:MAG: OB-fold protein [Ferruginibacter sp.]